MGARAWYVTGSILRRVSSSCRGCQGKAAWVQGSGEALGRAMKTGALRVSRSRPKGQGTSMAAASWLRNRTCKCMHAACRAAQPIPSVWYTGVELSWHRTFSASTMPTSVASSFLSLGVASQVMAAASAAAE